MAWTPLGETISAGQAGHITDHEAIHASWNNSHVQKVSTNTVLNYDYSAVVVNTVGGVVTITLPLTSGTSIDGHVFVIKRSGSSQVVINRAGLDTFDDGTTQKTLGSNGATIGLMSVADAKWYITGERGTVT